MAKLFVCDYCGSTKTFYQCTEIHFGLGLSGDGFIVCWDCLAMIRTQHKNIVLVSEAQAELIKKRRKAR